jgi:hypothetical protein
MSDRYQYYLCMVYIVTGLRVVYGIHCYKITHLKPMRHEVKVHTRDYTTSTHQQDDVESKNRMHILDGCVSDCCL